MNNNKKYILVDFENVQNINANVLKNIDFQMVIFCAEHQKHISIKLTELQQFGQSVKWKIIKTDNKKDFIDHIIIGYLMSISDIFNDNEFYIYSKDTGYDITIDILKKSGINIKRIVSFEQMQISKQQK